MDKIANKKRLMKPVIFNKDTNEVKLFEYACSIEDFSTWVKSKLTDELFSLSESNACVIKEQSSQKVTQSQSQSQSQGKTEKVIWNFPS